MNGRFATGAQLYELTLHHWPEMPSIVHLASVRARVIFLLPLASAQDTRYVFDSMLLCNDRYDAVRAFSGPYMAPGVVRSVQSAVPDCTCIINGSRLRLDTNV